MTDLRKAIESTPGCKALAPNGQPSVHPGHALPGDLEHFYGSCGGAVLFDSADFSVKISSPSELILANPVIVGEEVPDDITDSWYIVGHGGPGEFITIDLHPDRLGSCYDSFYEVHGVPGSCSVIARSFTELLTQLLASRGGHWYWLEPTFQSFGDAYDVVR